MTRTEQFYNDLAPFYHLIFPDWEASMARQGAFIGPLLRSACVDASPDRIRVLDVCAGIGTQSLPLSKLGFDVTARDASKEAIRRLRREADARGLAVDAAVADMRSVAATVDGPFDAVIAFDNSVPHLPDDGEISRAFRECARVLKPGGSLLVSVRDYGLLERGDSSVHYYPEVSDGRFDYRFRQEWDWLDDASYQTTFVGERRHNGAWTEVLRSQAVYYAVTLDTLLLLLSRAGFASCRVVDGFYQPVLSGVSP